MSADCAPCWICHRPTTLGLCDEYYSTPDPDIEIEIVEDDDNEQSAENDQLRYGEA